MSVALAGPAASKNCAGKALRRCVTQHLGDAFGPSVPCQQFRELGLVGLPGPGTHPPGPTKTEAVGGLARPESSG